jgi:2,5-diamino-6-(ribosylamino)-4(3H)-pyrimidinone 5'-phosphate reductase
MTLERLLDLTEDSLPAEALYTTIRFPSPPETRPYVYINMVATVDGKIVIGKPGGTARGVGGPTDQRLFRRLQQTCDGTLIGSGTLRAGPVIYPSEKARFVVTRSGDLPLRNRFFTDAPDRATILAPEDLPETVRAKLASAAQVLQVGVGRVDLTEALRVLRRERGIRLLLCEGGAALNADLIAAGLADELFLTLAPKIKGGANLPTPVTGEGFPPGQALPLKLLSLYRDEDELYLRYRLGDAPRRFGV